MAATPVGVGVALGESLTRPLAAAEQVQRALADEAAQSEARLRSVSVNCAITLSAGLLVVATQVLEARGLRLGELTGSLAAFVALGAWLPYEFATVTYYRLGPSHQAHRAALVFERLGRSIAVLTAFALSDTVAAFGMLLLSLLRSFAWRPQPEANVRRALVIEVIGHLAVASTCLALGSPGVAMMILLALGAYAVGLIMTSRLLARAVGVRVERDLIERDLLALEISRVRGRISRELHDGAGAGLMALVLQLRNGSDHDPALSPLHAEAQQILDDLRSVVWSIRGGEGTLAELVKLLDARCARLCEGFSYQRHRPAAGSEGTPVGAATALIALRVAPALVRFVASRSGISWLRIQVQLGERLELIVDADGLPEAPSDVRFVDVQRQVTELGGALSSGSPMRASISLG